MACKAVIFTGPFASAASGTSGLPESRNVSVDPNVFETANAGFAQAMYEEFLRDPSAVGPEWRRLFESGVVGEGDGREGGEGGGGGEGGRGEGGKESGRPPPPPRSPAIGRQPD